MTEHYDKQEQAMGISDYASPQLNGFSAVLKSRYSDFVVHEGKCVLSMARYILLFFG